MDIDLSKEQLIPSAVLTAINFGVSTETEKEKIAVLAIDAISEVNDPRLGLPNTSSQCTTCGSHSLNYCEGHFGVIKFPYTLLNPHYISEVAEILNKVCPGCKSIRQDLHAKGAGSSSKEPKARGCKYCLGRNAGEWYPPMKFKVSSMEAFQKTTITVEVNDKGGRNRVYAPPDDYWAFIVKDPQAEKCDHPNKRVLTHTQVRHLLNGIDPEFIKKYVPSAESIFISCFSVTPNGHRVTEFTHIFSNGQQLMFDERNRAYRKLVDFKGTANELSTRLLDCLKMSKLYSDKSAGKESANPLHQAKDPNSNLAGLRYMKDVVSAKRNYYTFRMVVVGDPDLKLSEIGIPCHIAYTLQVSEHPHKWNREKLNACCSLRLLEKGKIYVRRNGVMVWVRHVKELETGDIIYLPLIDGDTVLVNRPPSIHQHSLIALKIKVLPTSSVLSLNPLCCLPFRGDFDGDCLHGYIPQSVETRIELNELVALDKS